MKTKYFILEKKPYQLGRAQDTSEGHHYISVGTGKPESLIIRDRSITM